MGKASSQHWVSFIVLALYLYSTGPGHLGSKGRVLGGTDQGTPTSMCAHRAGLSGLWTRYISLLVSISVLGVADKTGGDAPGP